MAVMDRQFFIDMAAVLVLSEVLRRNDAQPVEVCAKMAYSAAEALWQERERRYQADAGTDSPTPAPTRVGPEF